MQLTDTPAGYRPFPLPAREFMQRLAALLPRLRLDLIRFHGALAPNAKLRAQVVPARQDDNSVARAEAEEDESRNMHHWSSRINWAQLLKRVCEVDMDNCPNQGESHWSAAC